ncbi:MAG: hypothetical protein WC343_11605 [Bacilli bacterium]|jgi:hypothetical protein
MSTLSSALAASLQNSDAIGPLITGVISGRNFNLQDEMVSTSPYACLMVCDLPSRGIPYIGGDNDRVSGQIEVRAVSATSEDAAKALIEAVKDHIRALSSVPWAGGQLPFGLVGWGLYADTSDDLLQWIEILTIDFKAVE